MSNPNAKNPAAEAKQMTASEAVTRAATELVDGKGEAKEGAVQGSETARADRRGLVSPP